MPPENNHLAKNASPTPSGVDASTDRSRVPVFVPADPASIKPVMKPLLAPQSEMSLNDLYALLLAKETMEYAKRLHPKDCPRSGKRPSKMFMCSFFWALNQSCISGLEGNICGIPKVLVNNQGDGFYPTFLIQEALSRDTYTVACTDFIPWAPA